MAFSSIAMLIGVYPRDLFDCQHWKERIHGSGKGHDKIWRNDERS
jgi:hypothetical protein